MLSANDFCKKQIIFVLANNGERIAFSNDNIIVKTSEGNIKFQVTCYRLFLIYIVGHCSLTSVVIQKAQKFGFFIALMTSGFKLYSVIGASKDGNTLLHKKQYENTEIDIAKHIIKNKIENQISEINSNRNKHLLQVECLEKMNCYLQKLDGVSQLQELMGYEGLAAKAYFAAHFNNVVWKGRKPRIKSDYVNSVLDIGYTMLFSYIDALLMCFGFDTYCGFLHKQFYMRKSLTCDIIEPFRVIIDHEIKKAINLRQIKQEDFIVINNQFRLKYVENPKYIKFLMSPIIENKEEIFEYVQQFYRSFMKGNSITEYPRYRW